MSHDGPVETSTNVEVAAAFFAALERGGFEALLPFLAPGVEVHFSGVGAVGVAEVYVGHDGVRRWIADWANVFDEYEANLVELTDVPPDRVIARLRARGLARGGVPIEMDGWQVAQFRDGLIVHVESFSSEGEARAVAGLPE